MATKRPKIKRKGKPRTVKSRARVWEDAQFLMMARSTVPLPDDLLMDFSVKSEASINALQYGTATEADFVGFMKIPIFGRSLAKLLGPMDESGQINNSIEVFASTLDAVDKIGDRYSEKGFLVPTGEELKMLRDSLGLCIDLLKLCNQGHAFQAANDTGTSIAKRLLVEKRHGFASNPAKLKILNQNA